MIRLCQCLAEISVSRHLEIGALGIPVDVVGLTNRAPLQ